MSFDTCTGFLQVLASWGGNKTATGADYTNNPLSNQNTITKKANFTAAGAAANQYNLLYSAITSLGPSASTSLDLTSLTDILLQAAQVFARVKGVLIRLLSATDDSGLGTAASSVTIDNTVTNALSAASHSGWFSNAAEGAANGSKFDIPNGGFMAFGVDNAAGVVVDGTHKIIKLTNNDAGLTAKVQVTLFGSTT